ncbi:Hypothetical predicted protein [Olea europaea subsp. europaea]|uniref:Uncharacterized protein n=1 Tax=Olea europaea subsp. europaea TaxID=158383 RepID=A0A8S0TG87_OLEEU|nr:Hypothetical predicted protein [Olea europaea subsp. europaea]
MRRPSAPGERLQLRVPCVRVRVEAIRAEVRSGLRLAVRCARAKLNRFQQPLLHRAQPAPAPPAIQANSPTLIPEFLIAAPRAIFGSIKEPLRANTLAPLSGGNRPTAREERGKNKEK